MQVSAEALMATLNDILDFSKIEAGKLELGPRTFGLRELVESALALLAEQAFQKGLELAVWIDDELPEWVHGDPQTLKRVAEVFAAGSRRGDGIYRYGGEEFVLVLPEQSLTGAALVAERFRERVERLEIPHPGTGRVVTVSAGVATIGSGESCSCEDVLRRADAALYRAKQSGRNCVALAAE